MGTKALARVELKDGDSGQFVAIISTFNVLDSDKDVTLPGAFDEGATVPVSAFGHASWEGKLPVGTATLKQTTTEGQAHGQFFMDTVEGLNTFRTVKALHEKGLGEWSYGYDATQFHFGDWEGQQARFLAKVKTHEVSPVLVGAGVGTRTLAVKGAAGVGPGTAIRPHETPTTDEPWTLSKAAASALSGIVALRAAHAWVNTQMDPDNPAAYSFLHHHPDGKANVRACLIGIASLKAGGAGPTAEADRRAIYEHLAAHIMDSGRTPPEFGGPLKLADRAALVLAEQSMLHEEATGVVALRSAKGRMLAAGSAEILAWIADGAREYRSLLNSPTEEAAEEYLRMIALEQRSRG